MVMNPATAHAPISNAGESTSRAISAETIKMPEPIIDPITSMAFRNGDTWQIKRHNQPVAGSDTGWLHVTSHHALGIFDQLPHQRVQRLDIGRIFQSVPIV